MTRKSDQFEDGLTQKQDTYEIIVRSLEKNKGDMQVVKTESNENYERM